MSADTTQLTVRFTEAVDFARSLHTETRKGGTIPYLAHLLSVSALVLEHGGSEDQAIAALLRDAAEDHGGQATLDQIDAQFGHAVAGIVRACSDSLTIDPSAKQAWWPRKVAYLEHLMAEPIDALLVSAADKVHNARSILADYRQLDDELWSRLNADAGWIGSFWYYSTLVGILGSRLTEWPAADLVMELRRTVDAIADHARSLGHDSDRDLADGRRQADT